MTEIKLELLKYDDREQFIKDNQEAFNYGAMEEFGMRDNHFEEDGQIISRDTIEKSIERGEAYRIMLDDKPVGALTLAGPTPNLYMLGGMKDACVLWDIRVDDKYKHQGIGQKLFDQAKDIALEKGYKKMIIESQNNNVTACRFYRKQGAVISKIDTNAYASEPGLENEVQLIWTLDFAFCRKN